MFSKDKLYQKTFDGRNSKVDSFMLTKREENKGLILIKLT